MGIWSTVEVRNHGPRRWVYAHYSEAPSERPDGRWFEALYFRNVARTEFGKLEFDDLARRDYRAIATKIDLNESYRNSLLSSDPELPRLWRKR